MIDCEKPGDCAYPGCECQDDNDPFNEEPAMTQTQPSLGRAKHQRGARCIYRDMTASELDRVIDTNAELLAALKAIQDSFIQGGRLLEGGEWLQSDVTQAAFDGMRSAITKAEGR